MGGPFNLVTITPPYEEVVYAELIKNVLDSPVSSQQLGGDLARAGVRSELWGSG